MAGKLLLQRYLLVSRQGLCRDMSVKRREETSPSLPRSILLIVPTKGLDAVSVGAIFYTEQRSLCLDLVRAVLPLQRCL